MTRIDVRRAADRFHTTLDWLDSWHSFSFDRHYDPANTGHGQLVVLNDDTVAPGTGFGTHGHRDMEIVTWVLDGALEHRDSTGGHGVIRPGLAQRMSAGAGIRHSEYNASATEPVHFLQMWVVPDTTGIEPGYEERDVTGLLAGGGLVPVASGQGHEGAISLHQRDAVMYAARLPAGEEAPIPDGVHVHVFVALGSGTLAGDDLARGDAARLVHAGSQSFTAGDGGAEIVVWQTA